MWKKSRGLNTFRMQKSQGVLILSACTVCNLVVVPEGLQQGVKVVEVDLPEVLAYSTDQGALSV